MNYKELGRPLRAGGARGDRRPRRRRRARLDRRAYLAQHVEALAIGGRLVIIGLMGGARAEIDLGTVLRQADHHHRLDPARAAGRGEGRDRRVLPRPLRRRARARRAAAHHPRRLPLAEAQRAHDLVEASEHFGKVVLRVSGAPSSYRCRSSWRCRRARSAGLTAGSPGRHILQTCERRPPSAFRQDQGARRARRQRGRDDDERLRPKRDDHQRVRSARHLSRAVEGRHAGEPPAGGASGSARGGSSPTRTCSG